MKTKLTITVDEAVVSKAKGYSRSRGNSLSQLIENQLSELISREESTFSQKWRGKFVIRSSTENDPRLIALKRNIH